MKKIFTLLLLLFPFFRAHAQPDSILKAQHDRLLSQLFAAQSYTCQPGAKTTGPAERLVAMNIYRDTNATGTWIRTDSARLTYSSTRGSLFNMQNMHFGSFSYLNTFWPGPTDFLIIISSLPYDSLYTY